MSFIFHCPYCQSPMTVPDELAGTAAACANCRQSIRLPAAPAPSVAPPASPTVQQPSPAASRPTPPRTGLPAIAVVLAVLGVAGLLGSGLYLVRSGALRKTAQKGRSAPQVKPQARGGAAATGTVGARYDGEWEGTTSRGEFLTFRVESGSVVFFLLQPTPGQLGPNFGAQPGSVPVSVNGTFQCKGHPGPSASFVLEGTFTSDTEAEGTVSVGDTNVPWTANRKGPPSGGAAGSERAGGQTAAQAGTKYDGKWEGGAGTGPVLLLGFDVKDGSLTSLTLGVPDDAEALEPGGTATLSSVSPNAPIGADGRFGHTGTIKTGPAFHQATEALTFEGAFTSESAAAGTHAVGTRKGTWTAKKK